MGLSFKTKYEKPKEGKRWNIPWKDMDTQRFDAVYAFNSIVGAFTIADCNGLVISQSCDFSRNTFWEEYELLNCNNDDFLIIKRLNCYYHYPYGHYGARKTRECFLSLNNFTR